jgi:REP element-mobilizing transposase RayT
VAFRENVKHRVRPEHAKAHPVHVTLRGRPGLPSFRAERVWQMLRAVLFGQRKKGHAGEFHVVELTIQDDHLHLIVQAATKQTLRAGISGLVIAFAKRLNKMLSRKGKVWGDRWHGRELASPREVGNALVYVFRNVVKHGRRVYGADFADPMSSAPRFRFFKQPVVDFAELGPWPEAPPRTWLLGTGWHTKHGRIDLTEIHR